MSEMPVILNQSNEPNYVSGTKIFIMGQINEKSCNELIGNISNIVDSLSWTHLYERPSKLISTNPYILKNNKKIPILDVYIDSSGGNISTTKSIMTQLNLARNKGAIIRTVVMGTASSCASLIAVQGTPGFRIMYEQAYHLIHYGRSTYTLSLPTEVDKAVKYEKEMRQDFYSPYLRYTALTRPELNKLQQAEYSMLPAKECLHRKICDWILTTDGKFIKPGQKIR